MCAGFYDRHVLPHLINLAMRHPMVRARRAELVPRASGEVLEVGIGSGLNIPFYSAKVRRLYGVDPSGELLAMALRRAAHVPFPVELLCQSAEDLPRPDASFDTIVTTWTLCSIPDPMQALREMRRVLKPGGRLLFVEHGRTPDASVNRWQDRLNPVWSKVAGGCNLNRPMEDLIRSAGFRLVDLQKRYLPGPKPMTYTYEGSASI
jgi:ubiquinone/menaquinone biosynthesis C-methylase UbiE